MILVPSNEIQKNFRELVSWNVAFATLLVTKGIATEEEVCALQLQSLARLEKQDAAEQQEKINEVD